MKAELAVVGRLLREQRLAGLGTLREGSPFVSMVAFALEPDTGALLLHLSRLAPHTGQLLADPRAALLISEGDDGRADPQTLARITLVGAARLLARDATDYGSARNCYLARLPAAASLFEFADFELFRFTPREARYIGGFARAYTLTDQHLRAAISTVPFATENTD